MNPPRCPQYLLRQASGALAWGIFFAVVPIVLLFIGVLVWVPVLIWREIVRSHRYGFFPGVLVRLGVVVATVTIAALLPVKYGDRRVRALPRTDGTLGELAAAHVLWPIRDEQQKSVRVTLPSTTPTRREVMSAIEQQTGYRPRPFGGCGTVACVLFGLSGGPIRLSKPIPQPQS